MPDNAVLSGDLRFISLADCFQILGSNNSTGTLRVTCPYVPTPGLIYMVDGSPVNAECGSLLGLDAVYPLFGWSEGSFEFFEEPVNVEPRIKGGRMEIVLDALRMLDDGLIEKVGPTSSGEWSDSGAKGSVNGSAGAVPVIRGPLADYMYVIDEEEFHDGVKIVTEGGHGNWIWVILEGMVEITRDTAKGTMYLARLAEGSFVGSLTSFLQRDYVRYATVRAVGDIQLGILDTQRLYKEHANLSAEFRDLILSLDHRLCETTDTAVALFESKDVVTSPERAAKTVIAEGSADTAMFSIVEGTAHVVRHTPKGDLPLVSLSKGDVAGPLPFSDIGHEPRCAAVMGSEELQVTPLDPDALRREYAALSPTLKNMINNTCTCLSVITRSAVELHARSALT